MPAGAGAAAPVPLFRRSVYVYQQYKQASDNSFAYAKGHLDVRGMDGHFMEIQEAMGTPKGRMAGAGYLRAYAEEMKASGFVADAIKRSNQSAAVAPPAAK